MDRNGINGDEGVMKSDPYSVPRIPTISIKDVEKRVRV